MNPLLRFSLLSCALVAVLSACGGEPAQEAEPAAPAPQDPSDQAEPAVEADLPPVAEVSDMGGVEDELDESLFENLKVRPVSHEALEVSLRAGEQMEEVPTTQAHGQSWAALEAGEPGSICVGNRASVPALASFSFQGLNVDLMPAHPIQGLWRIEPQTMRCFTFIAKDEARPLVAGWHIFFGHGEDGSQVTDLSAPAAASGFIRLEAPSKTPPPDAWPGLVEQEQGNEELGQVPAQEEPAASLPQEGSAPQAQDTP